MADSQVPRGVNALAVQQGDGLFDNRALDSYAQTREPAAASEVRRDAELVVLYVPLRSPNSPW
jgi:hypothetical protein